MTRRGQKNERIPSDHFHDVIVDFISGFIKRNPESLFSSIITTDPLAINELLHTYKDQTPSGLDEQVVLTFSTESLEYTLSKLSGSRTVTFNQSLLSPPSTPYKQQLKQDSKPQSTPIDNGKKLKQKETDNTLKNENVIITGYIPQDQEQAQLLDLVVYDILAKWDNYTLLANLGRWDKVISYFKKSLDFITEQLYPTLSFSIPVYNYLITMLNTVIADEDTLQEIKNAATEAKKKVLDYYPTSNKQMYTIVIVMDLRLKLQYFKKNKWKSPFISQVKAEVTEIWNSTYKNNNLDIESSDNIDDDLLSYIFRKQKTESDELVSYLKEPVISNKTDVLS
ncbi:hypothetical protein RclHR1_09080005 [Rhizophagus clarus]|nr:hypothetical protein RclHR1_09080005 [Rhizophagus clarus]